MAAKATIIRNGCLLTGTGRVIGRGFVHMEGGLIRSLGDDSRAPRIARAEVIDARGRYVLPGFINPHSHFYGALALGAPLGAQRGFGERLRRLWWRLDKALSLEDAHVSALWGAVQSLKAGVTTVFDHHAGYGAVRGSLHTIAEAAKAAGVKASICFELSDRAGRRARNEALSESASWIESVRASLKRSKDFPFRAMVGLHASMTLEDSTIEAAGEMMEHYRVGAHVHVAEGEEDVRATRRLFKVTPAARFAAAGILGPRSIAAHCVHVDRRDINLIRRSGVFVAHNPMSNLSNAVGIAPVLEMARKGVPVVVGTDGMSAGISGDARLAMVLHRPGARDARAGFGCAVDAVSAVAPKLASSAFGHPVGRLAKGARADVIISDASPRTPVGRDNAAQHLMFGVLTSPVRTTIVDGRARVRDFEVEGVDEAYLAKEARRLAGRLWRSL
jgi:putative selenium metabolism protein SsnA